MISRVTEINIYISASDHKLLHIVPFIVDTGACFSYIPGSILSALGYRIDNSLPSKSSTLADGSVVQLKCIKIGTIKLLNQELHYTEVATRCNSKGNALLGMDLIPLFDLQYISLQPMSCYRFTIDDNKSKKVQMAKLAGNR